MKPGMLDDSCGGDGGIAAFAPELEYAAGPVLAVPVRVPPVTVNGVAVTVTVT